MADGGSTIKLLESKDSLEVLANDMQIDTKTSKHANLKHVDSDSKRFRYFCILKILTS